MSPFSSIDPLVILTVLIMPLDLAPVRCFLGFSGGSMVKNLPVMYETQIWSLAPEDTLEKDTATHFTLAWEIPRTEEPGGL